MYAEHKIADFGHTSIKGADYSDIIAEGIGTGVNGIITVFVSEIMVGVVNGIDIRFIPSVKGEIINRIFYWCY